MNRAEIMFGNGFSFSEQRKKEIENKLPILGTVVAIVGIDWSQNGENARNPRLYTTVEMQGKPETDRLKGQISLIAETRKRLKDGTSENRFSNVIGALAEFSGDSNLIKGISFMPSSYLEGVINVKGYPADLAVAFIDGFPNSIPVAGEEVRFNGWLSLNVLRETDPSHLRSFLKQVISMEDNHGVIGKVVEDFFQHPEDRVSLSTRLPSNFSMAEFYIQREQMSDVVGNSGVISIPKK